METEAERDLSDLPKAAGLVGGHTWCRPRVFGHKAGIWPSLTANVVGILAFPLSSLCGLGGTEWQGLIS